MARLRECIGISVRHGFSRRHLHENLMGFPAEKCFVLNNALAFSAFVSFTRLDILVHRRL
jgi:hypothetical protein